MVLSDRIYRFSLAPTPDREERAVLFSDFVFIVVVVLLWQRYFTPGDMGRLAELRPFCLFKPVGAFFFFFLRGRDLTKYRLHRVG